MNSKTKKIGLPALFLAVAALTACGGGGSSGSTSPAPAPVTVAPAPTPAPAPAYATRLPVTSVPTPTYAAASFQLAAFNRINSIRSGLGLGMFAQNSIIDAAAQAHANYEKTNGPGNSAHLETTGLAGFTGATPGDRMSAAGYSATYWAEDIDFVSNGATAVDELVDAVYHRIPLLSLKSKDIGVGFLQTSPNQSDPTFNTYVNVLDLGFIGTGQGAPALTTVVWPADASTTTSTSMPAESPRPGTPGTSGVFGYPVSISTDEDRTLTVTTFTLTDTTGASVSCNLLSYSAVGTTAADPELVALNAKSFVALVPRDPLKSASTYTVQFVGTLDGVAYSRTWSFKTP